MNSPVIGILAAGLAGLALSGAYFAALWWTVRRSVSARRPGVLLIGSYLVRTALLAGGILLVGMRDWTYLTACLVGLLGARVIACRLAGAPAEADTNPPQPAPSVPEGEPTPCN